MTDTAATKAFMLRYFSKVISGADMAAIDAMLGDGFTMFSGPQAGQPMGPAGFKKVIAANHVSFPDWVALPDAMVVEGDNVVTRWTATATHKATFQGIPATGKRVTVKGTYWNKIADGRIVEQHTFADMAGLFRQLGATTEVRGAGEILYARHTVVFPVPDKRQAMADLLRDDAIPFYRQQPGYRGFVTLMRDDDLIGINFWADEAAWTAVREGEAHKVQREHFAALSKGFTSKAPVVTFYSVPSAEVTGRPV